MAVVADDFVRVALGASGSRRFPLMPGWACSARSRRGAHAGHLQLATGRERLTALMTGGNALLTVPVLLLAGQSSGIMGIAAAKPGWHSRS